jgi:2-iminoacetate synthase
MTAPWLDPTEGLRLSAAADESAVRRAVGCREPGLREMAALLSPAAVPMLEEMAQRAQALTRRHFGRTIGLYVPLYLSSYCSGGCVYCGFASDRDTPRHRLTRDQIRTELATLKGMGFEEVLLLTGERTPQADLDYVRSAVAVAAEVFHNVTIETFPMTQPEYASLAQAGCTGLTLYQETYDPAVYERVHRWGPKRDYAARLDAPARALAGGLRRVGLGVLLGLGDPVRDALCLYLHAQRLRREFWKAGVAVSFPRIRPQSGGFEPEHPVTERRLAQIIFAFRIALPDVPLVLSTRESAAFRDGMAGVGVNKMSVASRTTVGGYAGEGADESQFEVSDDRSIESFCAMLAEKSLEPVFKNWDRAYR